MAFLQECINRSMVAPQHFPLLEKMVNHINTQNIPGDIIECGVCGGGCIMWMAYNQKKYSEDRKLYLYDTYEGMTAPTHKNDGSVKYHSGRDELAEYNKITDAGEKWCYAPLEAVKENMELVNYKVENINFIKGDVCKTLDEDKHLPDKIAILRLDTDWYESTKKELDILYPRVSIGGWIILDDYFYWNGSRIAGDEWYNLYKHQLSPIYNKAGRAIVQRINSDPMPRQPRRHATPSVIQD